MSTDQPRRPTAVPLGEARFAEDPIPAEAAADIPLMEAEVALPVAASSPRRRWRWARLFFAGAGGLAFLALSLAIDSLIRSLFERADWLGWFGLALAALALLAAIALLIRELAGIFRLRRIDAIQAEAARAAAEDDRALALTAARNLLAFYADRPDTARARSVLAGHFREIIDGRDLIGLAERELLLGFDETARRMVLSSAKRVSLVTAISPRALVDVAFVFAEILRLIRRLATLYGGRPGFLGFVGLTRHVLNHLALTGGMAAGDSLVQQILGHGIAARLSARLGEGVVNGLLTARVGIAAIEVCRPLPFIQGRPPRLGDMMAELTRSQKAGPEQP